MSRVIALLDRPRRNSLGMVPFVTDEDGKVQVWGLAGASAHRGRFVSKEDVEQLIRAGHALRVDVGTSDMLSTQSVALWVGAGFEEMSKRLRLPLPPLPRKTFDVEGGCFVVGESSDLFVYLDVWVAAAFTRFLSPISEDEKRALAELMRWVLPSDSRTLAASWKSATREFNEIEFQHRIFGAAFTLDEWESKLRGTIENHRNPMNGMEVIAFVGGSASHREEIASRFAQIVASEFSSFTEAIKRRISRWGGAVEKWTLMERGQSIVDAAPLTMTLDVLRPTTALPHRKLVVDSVRHKEIWDSISWLIPQRVVLVSVVSPFERRQAELRRRGFNPEDVLSHPTEAQIDELSNLAEFVVNEADEWEPQLLRLREFVQEAYAH